MGFAFLKEHLVVGETDAIIDMQSAKDQPDFEEELPKDSVTVVVTCSNGPTGDFDENSAKTFKGELNMADRTLSLPKPAPTASKPKQGVSKTYEKVEFEECIGDECAAIDDEDLDMRVVGIQKDETTGHMKPTVAKFKKIVTDVTEDTMSGNKLEVTHGNEVRDLNEKAGKYQAKLYEECTTFMKKGNGADLDEECTTCNVVYDLANGNNMPTNLPENQEVDPNSGKVVDALTKKPIVTKSEKKEATNLPNEDPMQTLTGANFVGDATLQHKVNHQHRMLKERQTNKHFGRHIGQRKPVFNPLLLAHHHYRMLAESVGEKAVAMYQNGAGDYIVQQCDGRGDSPTLGQQQALAEALGQVDPEKFGATEDHGDVMAEAKRIEKEDGHEGHDHRRQLSAHRRHLGAVSRVLTARRLKLHARRLALKVRKSNAHIRHVYTRLIHRLHQLSFQHFRVHGRHLKTKDEIVNEYAKAKPCQKTPQKCAKKRLEDAKITGSELDKSYDDIVEIEEAIKKEEQEAEEEISEQNKKVEKAREDLGKAATEQEKEILREKLKEQTEFLNEKKKHLEAVQEEKEEIAEQKESKEGKIEMIAQIKNMQENLEEEMEDLFDELKASEKKTAKALARCNGKPMVQNSGEEFDFEKYDATGTFEYNGAEYNDFSAADVFCDMAEATLAKVNAKSSKCKSTIISAKPSADGGHVITEINDVQVFTKREAKKSLQPILEESMDDFTDPTTGKMEAHKPDTSTPLDNQADPNNAKVKAARRQAVEDACYEVKELAKECNCNGKLPDNKPECVMICTGKTTCEGMDNIDAKMAAEKEAEKPILVNKNNRAEIVEVSEEDMDKNIEHAMANINKHGRASGTGPNSQNRRRLGFNDNDWDNNGESEGFYSDDMKMLMNSNFNNEDEWNETKSSKSIPADMGEQFTDGYGNEIHYDPTILASEPNKPRVNGKADENCTISKTIKANNKSPFDVSCEHNIMGNKAE